MSDTSELVKRLTAEVRAGKPVDLACELDDLCAEAAEAIERLQTELAEARAREGRLQQIERVANLLNQYMRKSVNAGPLTNNPTREAGYWTALNEALAAPAPRPLDDAVVQRMRERGESMGLVTQPTTEREAERREAGTDMTWDAILSLYRSSNQWLDEALTADLHCSCGSCHLCAYQMLKEAAQQQALESGDE